jgi:hypothetical protein
MSSTAEVSAEVIEEAIAEPVPEAQVPVSLARARWEHAQLRALEDEIYLESMSMLRDALRFPELRDGALERWEEELGSREMALRRNAIAAAGAMPAKDAPIALQLAKSVVVAVHKGRKDAGLDAAPLGIQVQIVVSPPTFPRQRLSE